MCSPTLRQYMQVLSADQNEDGCRYKVIDREGEVTAEEYLAQLQRDGDPQLDSQIVILRFPRPEGGGLEALLWLGTAPMSVDDALCRIVAVPQEITPPLGEEEGGEGGGKMAFFNVPQWVYDTSVAQYGTIAQAAREAITRRLAGLSEAPEPPRLRKCGVRLNTKVIGDINARRGKEPFSRWVAEALTRLIGRPANF